MSKKKTTIENIIFKGFFKSVKKGINFILKIKNH